MSNTSLTLDLVLLQRMVYEGRDPFASGMTAKILDAWIVEAPQLYRVAKHPEDKEMLRCHIMDCQIALTMLPSPTSPARSPARSPTKKDKQD